MHYRHSYGLRNADEHAKPLAGMLVFKCSKQSVLFPCQGIIEKINLNCCRNRIQLELCVDLSV